MVRSFQDILRVVPFLSFSCKCAMGWRVYIICFTIKAIGFLLIHSAPPIVSPLEFCILMWHVTMWKIIRHFLKCGYQLEYCMPGYDRPHRKIETCAVEGLPVPSHPWWKCRWRSQTECRGTYGHIRRVSSFSSTSPKQCCSKGGFGPRGQWDHERFVFDLGWVFVLSQLYHRRESSKSFNPRGVSRKGFAGGWFRPKDVCGETWRIWVEQREGLQEWSKGKWPHKRPACLWHFSCIDSAVALSALALTGDHRHAPLLKWRSNFICQSQMRLILRAQAPVIEMHLQLQNIAYAGRRF